MNADRNESTPKLLEDLAKEVKKTSDSIKRLERKALARTGRVWSRNRF